jgi:hypothetical protein
MLRQGDQGAGLTDDLRPISLEDAFVRTPQPPLKCLRATRPMDPCVFGLRTLRSKDERGRDINIMLSDHLAGAIYRVQYDGTDFVVPMPIVGGSFQWSFSFDIRSGHNEQFNPTEAGCGTCDAFAAKSSSKLLEVRARDGPQAAVYTKVRPAYFREPGTMLVNKVTGKADVPVLNKTLLSDIIFEKRLQVQAPGVVDMLARALVPGDTHHFAIASCSCWVPLDTAGQVWVLLNGSWTRAEKRASGVPIHVKQGAGGLIVGTADGVRAMGVILADFPANSPDFKSPTYRVSFNERRAHVLWTLSQRVGIATNVTRYIPGGKWDYRVRMLFGSVQDLKSRMQSAERR